MSKSDKRAFRLYVGSFGGESQKLFIQLFDLLDRSKEIDDPTVKAKMGGLSSANYTNLKRHLYSKILIRLRLIEKEKKANIKIREYIDFVYVLYGKGLYHQALRLLDKAKHEAKKHHVDFSLITIIEIEKMIQSNHITRTPDEPIQKLVIESEKTINTLQNRIKLSNLRILLHKTYIERGHVKNADEAKEIKAFFKNKMPQISIEHLGMMEKIYLNQAQVWYHYILNDFEKCYDYAYLWVQLFVESRELRERDINLYLRGYHYLLTSAFNLKRNVEYKAYLNALNTIREENYNSLTQNSKIVSFLYVHMGRMNLHFLEGTFDQGIADINKTLKRIKKYRIQLDEHKIMVLYYKVSWMYIGNEEPKKAQEYLQYIIDISNMSLREDIQSYARLLQLMSIYDMQDYECLNDKVKAYSKYFKKTKEINHFQSTVMELFKQLSKSPLLEHKNILNNGLDKLLNIKSNIYEQRSFLYLDIISWLESKKQRKSISSIIKETIII